KRDKLDPLDLSRGGREFYQVQDTDRYCRKCPAGTHVAVHCKEQNGSSTCAPCDRNEFTEYPNGFAKCLRCRVCREDQVELSICQADQDTQCACRNGTFCSPDHPCEMCQKCQPRCPQGTVELAPCTPHSDRQCGPPTNTPGLSSKWGAAGGGGVGRGQRCELLLLGRRGAAPHAPSLPSRDHPTWLVCASLLPQDYLMRQLTRDRRGGQGTPDNIRNEQFSRDQLLPRALGSVTPRAPRLEVRERAPLLCHARPS
ncbi:TNR26 factor, partial [Bucorvus abyssinicus]|nr:TNR26 factor [Bucorvus abyssinicus]